MLEVGDLITVTWDGSNFFKKGDRGIIKSISNDGGSCVVDFTINESYREKGIWHVALCHVVKEGWAEPVEEPKKYSFAPKIERSIYMYPR